MKHTKVPQENRRQRLGETLKDLTPKELAEAQLIAARLLKAKADQKTKSQSESA